MWSYKGCTGEGMFTRLCCVSRAGVSRRRSVEVDEMARSIGTVMLSSAMREHGALLARRVQR
jgi:hypothetical protein